MKKNSLKLSAFLLIVSLLFAAGSCSKEKEEKGNGNEQTDEKQQKLDAAEKKMNDAIAFVRENLPTDAARNYFDGFFTTTTTSLAKANALLAFATHWTSPDMGMTIEQAPGLSETIKAAEQYIALYNELNPEESSEELGPFIKIPTALTLTRDYNYLLTGGRIVDYRSAADFVAGHIPGAVNIPATISNTASNGALFCLQIQSQFPDKTKPILFYGKKSAVELERIVPGRVSVIGYNYNNTFVLLGGYEEWIKEYPTEIETGPGQ